MLAEFSLDQTFVEVRHWTLLRLQHPNRARGPLSVPETGLSLEPAAVNAWIVNDCLVPFFQMAQGQNIGSYMTGSVLGKGAYGTVYQALDMKRGGFVAIKQIDLKRIPKGDLDSTMVTLVSLIPLRWKLTFCETCITKTSSAMWNTSKLMNTLISF